MVDPLTSRCYTQARSREVWSDSPQSPPGRLIMNEATNAGSGFFKPYTHQVAGHSQLKGKGDVGKLRDSLASQSVHVASKSHSAIAICQP